MSELPDGWARTTLGAIGMYWNGRAFKKTEWRPAGEGRPIIRIQDLTGSSGNPNYFDGEADERNVARRGDLLVSWAASLGVYEWCGPEAVINQHIFKVESFIDRRFHRYVIAHALDDLRRRAHGTGMVHVTRKIFDETPVLLPPLSEQARIVAAIEEHFSRLDAAHMNVAAARRKIAIYRNLVLAGVVPNIAKWLRTADVADVQGGIQKQPKRRPVQNRFPFLRVANVGRNKLDLSEVHEVELFGGEIERYRLEPGDLLVVEGNGSLSQIGRSALWRGEIDDCVYQNHLIRVRPSREVDPAYLALYWNTPQTAARLRQVASSTSGLYTLSTAKVKSIPVPILTLEQQREIVARTEEHLSVLDALIAAVAAAEGRSTALRRSILAEAFTGRLVPQNPDDEPASELLAPIAAQRANAPERRTRQRA